MSENTLKCHNTRVSKKEFHKSKQQIDLDLVKVDQIVCLTNLSIAMVVLNILLVIKQGKLLNRHVLSQPK